MIIYNHEGATICQHCHHRLAARIRAAVGSDCLGAAALQQSPLPVGELERLARAVADGQVTVATLAQIVPPAWTMAIAALAEEFSRARRPRDRRAAHQCHSLVAALLGRWLVHVRTLLNWRPRR
jgi:HAMP domain-containing protein